MANELNIPLVSSDSHLSFKELLTSLPKDLSKKQVAYLKKVNVLPYFVVMWCDSCC